MTQTHGTPCHVQIHFKMLVFWEVTEIQNPEADSFLKDCHLHIPSFFRYDLKCILEKSVCTSDKTAPPNKRAQAQGVETTCEATQLIRGKAGLRGRVSDTREGKHW